MSSKSKSEAFKKGDRVQARWSGSNVFYDAKVMEVSSRSYKVQFDDGSVSSVKTADVKKISVKEKEQPKRAAKSRSRSSSAARSRSRSPARKEKKSTRGRPPKKSPSEVLPKKTEISPSTNNVDKDEIDGPVTKNLARNKIGLKDEVEKDVTSSSITTNSYSSKKVFINLDRPEPKKSKRNYVDLERPELSTVHSRISARLASFKFAESTSEKTDTNPNAVKKSDAKYSDEESSEEEIEIVKKPSTSLGLQILYFLLTLFRIVILPMAMLFLIFACTKKQCTVLEVPQFFTRWRDFGNSIKYPMASVISFHVALCVLSLIPLGKRVAGFPTEPNSTGREYNLNGLFCLVFTVIAFSTASYFDLYMNWGLEKFKSISLSAVIYCVFCSLLIHIVSLIKGNGNKQSSTPLIGNFYHGSYINPFMFGKIDIKSSFVRAGLIGSVILNLSVVLKYFFMKGTVTIPMASTVFMQTFFVLDYFIKEETMLSSAAYTIDTVGYGFILTAGFLIPFGLVLQTVYLFFFESRANAIPHYCSGLVILLFIIGYLFYRFSSNIKYAFRRNPFSTSLSGLESIPTSKKKRLISSGLWGKVRHPNYVGLFIMATAWTLPCGFSHLIPYVPLFMLAIALVTRCIRVEKECFEKYGPAWTNYTEKVRKRFIPYIF